MEPVENTVADSEIQVFNLADLWDDRPITEIDISTFLVEGLMLKEKAFRDDVKEHDWSQYEDRPVVVKGCGDEAVPEMAYVQATQKLQEVARKLMYGEPCSSVPLWRRPKDESDDAKPDAKAVGVDADLPTPNA